MCFKNFGKRKNAFAQIFLKKGTGLFIINKKKSNLFFFTNKFLLNRIKFLLNFLQISYKYDIFIKIKGGGVESQITAIILGLSKIFSNLNKNYYQHLKNFGFLDYDFRIKERKKYGLKKARKASQYSKR